MLSNFSTTLSAKWILSGEHTVVRQQPAIVYPLPYYYFHLDYIANASPWQVTVKGKTDSSLESLFLNTLESAIAMTKANNTPRQGAFTIENTIPISNGLGASGAFCLAICQWLAAQQLIEKSAIYHHAKKLEDLFHGQSSGLDIVGAGADSGQYFCHGKYRPIEQNWQPFWYLSSSGSPSQTSGCVAQVTRLWQENPSHAEQIDKAMCDSVHTALQALESSESCVHELAKSINLAQQCFRQWGLVNTELQTHMDALEQAGAVATKPTGSGGGGYVISLWEKPLTNTFPWPMIPLTLSNVASQGNPTQTVGAA